MGIEYQGRAYISPRELEAWSDTGDISRLYKSLEGIPINNSTAYVATIGNPEKLG